MGSVSNCFNMFHPCWHFYTSLEQDFIMDRYGLRLDYIQFIRWERWQDDSFHLQIYLNILHKIISIICYYIYIMFLFFILDKLYHSLSYFTILNYITIYSCICMCALCVLYLHAHTTCANRLQIKRIVIGRIVKESILWGQQMDSFSHCDSTRQQWPKPIGEGK